MSDPFESLSDVQREIVFGKSGKFVVRACPGSGKTYSVAARLAYMLKRWERQYQGIATLSFTNVAWQEIYSQINTHFGLQTSISYPHFLGTIDSFINNNIFLPFGHLVLNCKRRPQLVGEPYGTWHGRNYPETLFDNISFGIDDQPIVYSPQKMPQKGNSYDSTFRLIMSSKKRLLQAGFAIQHDADYFAMRILQQYPIIAKALSQRYPVLIVDEAQDTSDIQMRIMDLLIEAGLREVMLVGDPDQAIFEWNKANPQLFHNKYQEWNANSILLNENRRSSQIICDFTCKLSTLSETSNAITEGVQSFPVNPKIVTYSAHDISLTVDQFLKECEQNNIELNVSNVAIIYRSRDIFNLIKGAQPIKGDPWKDRHTKELAKGKYLFNKGETTKGFRLLEKGLLKALNNVAICLQEDIERRIAEVGFTEHRKYIYDFLCLLPETNCSIGEWIDKANEQFKVNGVNFQMAIANSHSTSSFEQLFGIPCQSKDEKYRLGTVHSVKGETFESVLLFLKTKGGSHPYRTLIRNNVPVSENEELRIVYVGITRPRKILTIAVPDEESRRAWMSKFDL